MDNIFKKIGRDVGTEFKLHKSTLKEHTTRLEDLENSSDLPSVENIVDGVLRTDGTIVEWREREFYTMDETNVKIEDVRRDFGSTVKFVSTILSYQSNTGEKLYVDSVSKYRKFGFTLDTVFSGNTYTARYDDTEYSFTANVIREDVFEVSVDTAVEGNTYSLKLTANDDSDGSSTVSTVSYTAAAGDTTEDIVDAMVDPDKNMSKNSNGNIEIAGSSYLVELIVEDGGSTEPSDMTITKISERQGPSTIEEVLHGMIDQIPTDKIEVYFNNAGYVELKTKDVLYDFTMTLIVVDGDGNAVDVSTTITITIDQPQELHVKEIILPTEPIDGNILTIIDVNSGLGEFPVKVYGDIDIDGNDYVMLNVSGTTEAFVFYNGRWTSSNTSTGSEYTRISDNVVLNSSSYLMVDTSASSITVTLPAFPTLGMKVTVLDVKGNASNNNIVLDRNSKLLMGTEDNLIVDIDNKKVTLVYAGDDWRIEE